VEKRKTNDTNLTPEDHERITRAFRFTLGEIRRLYKSQAALYRLSRRLKKRVEELERPVSSFIELS
jgi:hypothetical protein